MKKWPAFAKQTWRMYSRIFAIIFLATIPRLGLAQCDPPPSGIVAWWGADNSAIDYASTNNGVLQSGAGYGLGMVGQAFNLNGTSAYVQTPYNPQWAFGTNSFTIELWANFASASGSRAFLSSDAGGGNNNKWIFWLNGGVLQFHINGVNGSTLIGTKSFSPVLNQWYHVAVTRQGTQYVFFINGSSVSTNSDSTVIPDSRSSLVIGEAEANFFFNGLLDEVSIYNRALSASEVAAIYSAGSAGKCEIFPQIAAISPTNNTVQIATNTPISVTFTRSMIASTLNPSTFLLSDYLGNPVAGSVNYVDSNFTATFIPSVPLASNNVYIATITTGVAATNGVTLTGSHTWQFSTPGNSAFILNNTVVGATVTNYDGQDLIVANAQLNVTGGIHIFNSVSVAGAAALVLGGGTVKGAAISTTNGASVIVNGNSILDGVTMSGSLDVGNTANNVALTITNGLTLNGTALVGNAANQNYGQIDFSGSQTLGGNGSVVFGNNSTVTANALRLVIGGTSLTIGPGITIAGQNGAVGYSSYWAGPTNVNVINQGMLSETINTGTLTVAGAAVVNQGLCSVLNGGILTVSGSLTNTGTFSATNSSVVLAGSVTTPNLGLFNGSNVTVTLTGLLVNTNSVLSVNAFGGTFRLSPGGYVLGGTVSATNGASLLVAGGTLDGVTVNGALDDGKTLSNVALSVTNGLTLYGTALVGNPTNQNYGQIDFYGSQALGGTGTVIFGNNPTITANALRLLIGGTTLTIGPGITIAGQNGAVGYSSYWGGGTNVSLINSGNVSESVNPGTITVAGASVMNQGLFSCLNGGTLTVSASFTNVGIISATNSSVVLAGMVATANLGLINATNATVYLTGTLINTDTALSVNTLGGILQLSAGGYVLGGTIIATNGALLLVAGGTLDGVTINGTLDVGNTLNNVALTVTNGLTLNGTALVGNPSNHNYGQIDFGGSQTLGGTGAVVFGNNTTVTANALRLTVAGTTLTIGPGITITGQNGAVGYSSYWGGSTNVSVINLGTISEPISLGTITIAGTSVLNQGALACLSGGTLAVSASLTNTGTFSATNSSVVLGGTLTPLNLGLFNSTGTAVYLTGVFNNTNTTLSVNALGGTWYLNGGTINGGAIVATNGSALIVEGTAGVLNGVTVNGTLDVGKSINAVGVTVTNGLVLNGTALVGNPTNAWYGGISFAGTQTLGGNGTVTFGNNGTYSDNTLRLPIVGTTLTIGPGIIIQGQNGVIGYASAWGGSTNVSVINLGVISESVSLGTLTIAGASVLNQGFFSCLSGGTLAVSASLTNTGTFSATNGSVVLGGTLNLANLGLFNASATAVYLTGVFNNTNTTVSVNVLGGIWYLNGGTINGGAIIASNASALVIEGTSGILNGVTVDGTLDVGNRVNAVGVIVTNGLVLNGTVLAGNPTNSSYGGVSFAGTQTLAGNGTVIFGNNGNYSYNTLRLPLAGTTLTVGPGITILGQNGVIGYASAWGGATNVSAVNQGNISESVNSGTITMSGLSLLNQGALSSISSGTLAVTSATFTNQGSLSAMQGVVALNSGFAATSGALAVGLSSSSSYGKIQVTGSATLGGAFNVVWVGGFVPAISNSFSVVTYGSENGSFSPLNLPASPAWQVSYGATALTVQVADVSKLSFTSPPTNTSAGAIMPPVVVQVVDSGTANPVATAGASITLSLASGTGMLSGTLTQSTDSSGKATFNDLSVNLVGVKTILATAIPAGFTPVTSGPFTNSVGPPARVSLLTAFASPQQNGVAFSPAAVVQVQDQFANVVSNSTAPITASLALGGGKLGGTTNQNANAVNGTCTFANLQYTLANSTASEAVAIAFNSPGLISATSAPVTMAFVFSLITLTNGNSIVLINPASQAGMTSWTVDGIDQLYQHWFWLREGSTLPQSSLDALGSPFGLAYAPSNAVINFVGQGLNVTLGVTLSGGAPGSGISEIVENLAIQNSTNVPIVLHFFEYSDYDLAGDGSDDTLSFPSTNTVVQQGNGTTLTETLAGPAPGEWESSWYALTLDRLNQGVPISLANQSLSSGAGDQTFAHQWDVTLIPGQSSVIGLTNNIGSASTIFTLALTASGNNLNVSWSGGYPAGTQLYSTTNLAPNSVWSMVTNVPVLVNGLYQIVLSPTQNSQFFRLQN